MDLQQIFRKLGIENLNDMQRQTADMLLHRSNDVVVLSATGSGKTLAYLLPLVQMLRADVGEVQAVVIVPGRELALQQHEDHPHEPIGRNGEPPSAKPCGDAYNAGSACDIGVGYGSVKLRIGGVFAGEKVCGHHCKQRVHISDPRIVL